MRVRVRRSARRRLAVVAGSPRRTRRSRRWSEGRRWLLDRLDRHPALVVTAVTTTVSAAATVAGGPVAALVAGVYGGIAARMLQGRRRRRRDERILGEAIESVGALAADLRAGLHPAGATAGPAAGLPTAGPAAVRVRTARVISDRLGAPLADLLDRVDADLRAGQRLRLGIGAQTAGANATAVLLAGLPVAGIALGAGLGADPLHLLLRTPLGAVCAAAALGLQSAGLLWTSWLVRRAVAGVD